MSPRVLVVEDDAMIASPLVRTLEREGYDVTHIDRGLDALRHLHDVGAELVLLDLGLPDVDGLEVCRRLREDGFLGAIMILTARGGELDRVVGLDVGADDYLAKPFGLSELLARSRALLRRTGASPSGSAGTDTAESAAEATPRAPTVVTEVSGADDVDRGRSPERTTGHLHVDTKTRRVWVRDAELTVTAKEFDVLAVLDAEPGSVVTRESLMDQVWDENWFGSTKTLDTTIGRLRQKFEEHAVPARIVTVRGVGFRLEREPTDA